MDYFVKEFLSLLKVRFVVVKLSILDEQDSS